MSRLTAQQKRQIEKTIALGNECLESPYIEALEKIASLHKYTKVNTLDYTYEKVLYTVYCNLLVSAYNKETTATFLLKALISGTFKERDLVQEETATKPETKIQSKIYTMLFSVNVVKQTNKQEKDIDNALELCLQLFGTLAITPEQQKILNDKIANS